MVELQSSQLSLSIQNGSHIDPAALKRWLGCRALIEHLAGQCKPIPSIMITPDLDVQHEMI